MVVTIQSLPWLRDTFTVREREAFGLYAVLLRDQKTYRKFVASMFYFMTVLRSVLISTASAGFFFIYSIIILLLFAIPE